VTAARETSPTATSALAACVLRGEGWATKAMPRGDAITSLMGFAVVGSS
jgi:hypothetical protein